MLKIVFDTTPLQSNPTGVGLYVVNLVSSLYDLQFQENFELGIAYQPNFKTWLRGKLTFPEILQKYSNLYMIPLPIKISTLLSKFPNPVLSYFEKYFGYPNILHGNDYTVYRCQKSLKVMTIYDLAFIKYSNYTNNNIKSYERRVKESLKWTDLVITISESSKKDIIEYLHVDPNQVYVTPLASCYDANYLATANVQHLQQKTNYDFSKPYILFVSTIEPRKNINAIISAFDFLKHRYKIEHQLVLVGRKGWNYEPIFTAIAKSPWQKEIHHLDYLSNQLVALFYSQADVFVYPSHYEGFGLPILESMTLGAPVVSSNTSSIPEVTGDAAILIDPNDYMQLAEAILTVISDSQLRQDLINKGKARAKLFSWERTARDTLKAYRSITY